MKKIILSSLLLLTSLFASYTTSQAKNHIGKNIEVCGEVDDVYNHKNGHIFLNIDGKYPNQKMSIVIWKNYTNNFKNITFLNKTICVKGIVKEYKNMPEIYLENKDQMRFK
jgi:DNA/RNA endonuclease YhcR with UshA esterase domain